MIGKQQGQGSEILLKNYQSCKDNQEGELSLSEPLITWRLLFSTSEKDKASV